LPAYLKYPRSSGAVPFLDYASFVSAARPSAPSTTASTLVPRHDRARLRPLTPAPRRDIAKLLALCHSETQKMVGSLNVCLVLRFSLSKNIDRETRLRQEGELRLYT